MDFIETMKNRLIHRAVECCPHCHSKKIVKFGLMKNGRQRYKCNGCRRTFSQFTKTPISYSKKPLEIWATYIVALSNAMTIKMSANISSICQTTSFYWRHKLLNSLKIQGEEELENEVQLKEFVMPKSNIGNHKDKNIIWRRQRYRHSICLPSVKLVSCVDTNKNRGIFPIDDIITGTQIKNYILPKIKTKSILRTRRYKLYVPCAIEKSIEVKEFKLYEGNHMNSDFASLQQMDFRIFLKNFRGVSTKYLTFYSNWFIWLKKNDYGQYLSLMDMIMTGMNKLRIYEFPRVNLRGQVVGA